MRSRKPPRNEAGEPLAVRIAQASRLLGIGRSTLYQFINAGEIETIKVGRSTLIPTESLHAFLERRRRQPPGQ